MPKAPVLICLCQHPRRGPAQVLLSSLHPSLLRNASLTSLDLSDNPLGPGVGVAMSHVLGISDSLTDLDLTRCQVRLAHMV